MKKIFLAIILLFMIMLAGIYINSKHDLDVINSIFNGYTIILDENGNNITHSFVEEYENDYFNGIYFRISYDLKNKTTITMVHD